MNQHRNHHQGRLPNSPSGEPTTPPRGLKPTLWGVGIAALVIAALIFEYVRTSPVRNAVRAYSNLLSAANRGDLSAVRDLCTERYLRNHKIQLAEEGGVIGLPRNIHKNFRAWQHGEFIWLCPTNRVGPVYQFVPDPDGWKFDGPVGQLRPGNQFEPILSDQSVPSS